MRNNFVIHGDEVWIKILTTKSTLLATVSLSDLDFLLSIDCKWSAIWKESSSSYYVVGRIDGPYENQQYLHRVLLNPEDMQVDHINGDTLDNRRSNLRLLTNGENKQNQKIRSDNTSGYRGVIWNKQQGKWQGKLQVDGKSYHIGLFDDVESAAEAVSVARENMMPYTNEERVYSNNSSGVRGVFWNNQRSKWQGRIQHEKKKTHIGFFDTIEEASAAVEAARANQNQ